MKNFVYPILVFLLFISFIPKKELTWTAIGDSITYMDGKPEVTKNRITKGYMQRVVEKLPYITYKNKGYSGWTAGAIAYNIDKIGLEKSDIYSVFLGTNDWWTEQPLGTFSDFEQNTGTHTVYGSFRVIIDKLRSLNPNAKIILITPMQRTDYSDVNGTTTLHGSYKERNGHMLSEYADAIKTVAQAEKCELVDLYYKSGITPKTAMKFKRLKDPKTGEYKNYTYPEYTNIPYNAEKDDYCYPIEAMNMTYDGLHPSDKGYAILAKMLINCMKNI